MSITASSKVSGTPILQFGTSRFLQAHADLFISDALATGAALGPATVVQSSGDPARAGRLLALADPAGFPVQIRGTERGAGVDRVVQVRAITCALSSATDWAEVARIGAEKAEVIISNTSDSGWKEQAADGARAFDQAMSYPAKLTHLLLARFRAGGRAITVLPTELVARNGDALRARVQTLAKSLDPGFANWVAGAALFGNSLVDRIVSAPLEPAGAVAEPYALWAIEAQAGLTLPCTHPCIQIVPDLARIERLKLHILNLGHTVMVADWLAAGGQGAPLVRQVMADAAARARLEDLYQSEVLPVFAAAGYGAEAADYVATTLDRFTNPFLDHKLSDIAQNHAEKLQRRIGDFMAWGQAIGAQVRQPRLRAYLA